MSTASAAAGLALAAVFVCAAAPGPPAPVAVSVSGPGRCVIAVGDAERPCTRIRIFGPSTLRRVEVDAPGGGLALTGPAGGELGDYAIGTIDYGAAHDAPAKGTCSVRLTSDGAKIEDVSCDTSSTFGQLRVRFVAAP